ncbi:MULTISPECIES: hydroxymethylglutaryl-CoA lyase [unclassified Microbacterium]|uniref:hydroxymethylglutaryl-CoA lyase n=1 Tax=unclassified Microbacterium TaxID=2609290 RepID=UPI0012F796C5|nr:hydroxymethylglutaryl-CoA lyase [Microbacterium sp. MAH-37]MVQ41509.1 hydroxymethylglutaryl-CoA lyase [Microbacterium sp. MAH-37]
MSTVRTVGLPDVVPAPGAGRDAVEIWEVSPRDGLQAESTRLDADTKVALIQRLAAVGARIIEAGSFVRPDRVPQMADSAEVLQRVSTLPVRTPVLVPNLRGYDLARAAGAEDIAVFLSVTESFSQQNLGASRERMEESAQAVVARAIADGVRVRGYLSMVFGDPWEGPVSTAEVVRLAATMRSWGIHHLSLGDTIGVATPGQVRSIVRALVADGIPLPGIALHMHDTYGMAAANVYAGLEEGVRVFDASAGGVGGCPFAKSATGNLATDDLVWMLEGLGIRTGIDLDGLVETSAWLTRELGKAPTSRVATALTR